ncbi:MAG: 23S rRNA (guanosine(2251)-2'-O)-methyltransferase RlmB [Candidatus Obscuribacter sp.]|nr:23S rRNA (guanosine(2251)-2'-O)-methyltransferase RlmB [Candidatus Obscuribacter sp.]MBK9278789.1 23S rRNA (guanosine(2251)-2'-O)-methyltransferase RlmB [Candidatus Obscuribacter sp.]
MKTGNKRPSGGGSSRSGQGKGKPNAGFGKSRGKSFGQGDSGRGGGRTRSSSGSSASSSSRSYGSKREDRPRSQEGGGYEDKKRSYARPRSQEGGGYEDKKRTYSRPRSEEGGGYEDRKRTYSRPRSEEGGGGYEDRKRTYSRPRSEEGGGGYEDRKRTYSRPRSEEGGGGYEDRKRTYSRPRSEEGGGGYEDRKRTYSRPRSEEGGGGYEDRKRTYSRPRSQEGGSGGERRPYSRPRSEEGGEKRSYSRPRSEEGGERRPYSRPRSEEGGERGRFSTRSREGGSSGFDRGERQFRPRERGAEDLGQFDEEAPPERTRVGRYGSHAVTELPVLDQAEVDAEFVYGRNSVVAFLERGSAPVNKIFIAKDTDPDRRLDKIVALAKDNGIPTVVCDKGKLSTLIGDRDKHQGVVAQMAASEFVELPDFLDKLDAVKAEYEARGESMDGYSIAILDGIEDPHNIGAIIRSADAAGVKAILLPQRRSAGLTSTVAKVSAGALASMTVVRITNIVATLEKLKDRGFWVAGLSLEGAEDLFKSDLKRPLALVIGSEGDGISRLVAEHCDMLVKIPMAGQVQSLNASVAAGVVFYEIVRQNVKA